MAKGKILSAGDFFRSASLKQIEIPELPIDGGPGIVFLQKPTAGAVIDFMESKDDDLNEALFRLIAEIVVDEKGKRIFSVEQASQLRDMSLPVFTRLSNSVTELINEESKSGN